ncbi:RNA ligase family protein [Nonomuraea sp. NN258]|uniref:RNA ligase family protein n=1 Tax=Nonomuraea antri TaxID=2730852 RepID=UPI0015699294|nr:RNA ligase family protein [Nonomuraea antri]NRQ36814.1 RNA ligase family protein [Nonomuraea antri]
MFHLADADLRVLNSLTKYPSIPTHHRLDPHGKGSLLEECAVFTGPVVATEKVDGTNARIILTPDGSWLIGSRDELLTASGDIVANPALGIVDALRGLAESLRGERDAVEVYYLEVYGSKKLPAWRQYGQGEPAHRLFDLATIPLDLLAWDPADISRWRDGGGQSFAAEADLAEAARRAAIPMTPRLATFDGGELPGGVEDMRAFLEPFKRTQAATDGTAGDSEGVVLRAPDRSLITKARFQDYDRTLKRRAR